LKDPPSAEAGEITDKRSINQRLVMQRRANEVELLYAQRIDPRIIEPAGTSQQAQIGAPALKHRQNSCEEKSMRNHGFIIRHRGRERDFICAARLGCVRELFKGAVHVVDGGRRVGR